MDNRYRVRSSRCISKQLRAYTFDQARLVQEKEKNTHVNAARPLLEEIAKEPVSFERKEKIIDALNRTQRKHVSNYIHGNRQKKDEYGDEWPLDLYIGCDAELTRFQTHFEKLKDLMDPTNGLLDKLFKTDCRPINYRKMQKI